MRRSFAILFLASVVSLGACKRGSARGARLVGERVPQAVAAMASVDPSKVTFKVEDEPFRLVWFVTATTPGSPRWRCFFDTIGDGAQWCDHGEGTIFSKLVAHRRLGDNRGSIDDATWLVLLEEAYGWPAVFPAKDFPIPSDEVRHRLSIPHVERPKDGGLEVDLDVCEVDGSLSKVHVSIRGEGSVVVTKTPIPVTF